MAVGHIQFNDQTPYGARLRSFLNMLDTMFEEGNELLRVMAQMKDSGAVGQYLADQFGFGLKRGTPLTTAGTVATAQAGVGEFESLMGKLNTTGEGVTTSHVADAITQALAKFA